MTGEHVYSSGPGYEDESHTWTRDDWNAAIEGMRQAVLDMELYFHAEPVRTYGWTDAEYAALERRIGYNPLGGAVAVLDHWETASWNDDEALRSRVMQELFDGLRERGVTPRTRFVRVHGTHPLGAGALVALIETSHGLVRQLVSMRSSRVRWPWRIQSEPWRPGVPDYYGVRAALSSAILDEWEGATPAPTPTESGKLGWTIGWDAPSIVQGLAGGACPIDGTPKRAPRLPFWDGGRHPTDWYRRRGLPEPWHWTRPTPNRATRRKQQR
jgi:hypothetical protein